MVKRKKKIDWLYVHVNVAPFIAIVGAFIAFPSGEKLSSMFLLTAIIIVLDNIKVAIWDLKKK